MFWGRVTGREKGGGGGRGGGVGDLCGDIFCRILLSEDQRKEGTPSFSISLSLSSVATLVCIHRSFFCLFCCCCCCLTWVGGGGGKMTGWEKGGGRGGGLGICAELSSATSCLAMTTLTCIFLYCCYSYFVLGFVVVWNCLLFFCFYCIVLFFLVFVGFFICAEPCPATSCLTKTSCKRIFPLILQPHSLPFIALLVCINCSCFVVVVVVVV